MNLYTRALKYIDMNRVKELRDNRIAEQIALAEKQYLLYFTDNTIPKYYDWETGQFNVTPLAEVKSAVLKRLEEIDDALSEGMTMKDFKYLYSDGVGSQILSISPTLVSSTFAQDLISASGEVTSHMFGPDFPGSHINSIGDFDKPESLSKADINMMAVPTPAGDAIAWNPFDQTLPTNYQLGNSTPVGTSTFDNTAALMVSRGETTDTHTDIYYTPNISQTDDVITLQSGGSRTAGGSGDYQELDAEDLMRLTGLYVGNNITKPNSRSTNLPGESPGGDNADQKFVVPNLQPMPYGYDMEGPDPDFPDENTDYGEPRNVVPMLRTFNNKSAGDQITFEWELNAGNTNVSNPSNNMGDGDFDTSSWVYINGDNKFYKLANIYDHDTLRIGDDDFYADTVGGHYDDDGDAVGFDAGDRRQDDNAGRKSIRPAFRSGGSGKANGSFAYTVKSGDIDSNGNFKMWILMSLTNRSSDSLRITGMTGTASAADKRKQGAGQLGQTTDAYDLGYRVQTPEEIRKLLKGVDVDELKILSGDVDITAGEFKKVLEKNPQVASAFKKLLTQGMVFKDYLTGNLPDVIDNKYLGQKYVNSIFKDAEINSNGTISVGDNIVGTGGKATYDKKTGEVTIPFNYDFKKNTEEFRDPSKAGHLEGPMGQVRKAVLNAVGDYNVDATPVTGLPAPLNAVDTFSGIMFGAAIAASKALGGAKHKPGNVTMSADKLEKINPLLHAQLVGFGRKLKEELYPGQPSPNGFPDTPPPKMAPNGYHPEFGKRSDRYRTLDPISAKTMNKVGTDDPKTNKQVAAAAKKPKVNESTWDKLKRHRPRG